MTRKSRESFPAAAQRTACTKTILPYTLDYMGIILIGSPFIMSSFVLNNQLRYQGSANYAMVAIVIGAIIGYLIGSIPFALIISKIFYKTDVRKLGSGSLGSANVGRTLGPLAGVVAMLIDLTKAGIPALILYKIAESNLLNQIQSSNDTLALTNQLTHLSTVFMVTGLASCIGHCYPIFANFKGGKAVASIAGFLIVMNYKLAIVAFSTYVIVLLITKVISLCSISSAISTLIVSFIPFFKDCPLFSHNELSNQTSLIIYHLTIILYALLLIYRHLPNIKRLIKGEEKKFRFEHKSRN